MPLFSGWMISKSKIAGIHYRIFSVILKVLTEILLSWLPSIHIFIIRNFLDLSLLFYQSSFDLQIFLKGLKSLIFCPVLGKITFTWSKETM